MASSSSLEGAAAAAAAAGGGLRGFLWDIAGGGAVRAVQALVAQRKAGAGAEFRLDGTLDPGLPDQEGNDDPRRITGITAAGLLCRQGETEALQRLVAFVALEPDQPSVRTDLNKGRGTSSPLLLAAAYGHADCVRVLLASHRINVNSARRDGVSALTIACQQGHIDVVKLLCRSCPRLQINKRTLFPERVTPCLLAIRAGREDVLRLLLEHPRFDLQENKYGGSKSGQSAIQVAEALGKERIAEMLRAHQVDMQTSSSVTAVLEVEARGKPKEQEEEEEEEEEEEVEQQQQQQQPQPFDVKVAFLALARRVTMLEAENADLKRRLASVETCLCDAAMMMVEE